MLPDPATLQARWMHDDWLIFIATGAFVGIVVYALIFLQFFLSRRKYEGHWPDQFKTNVALEWTYTVIPLLIVLGLFILTMRVEHRVEDLTPNPDVTVNVTAFRWSWEFEYPQAGLRYAGTPLSSPTLVMPVDETTRINLTSSDVNHAFWIPGFLFKRDAIPGVLNSFDLHPTRIGTYPGSCAEFCGLDHAQMLFNVRVVSPSAFQSWLASQRQTALLKRPHRT